MHKNIYQSIIPLIIGLSVVLGFYLGKHFDRNEFIQNNVQNSPVSHLKNLPYIIQLIENYYVDTVNVADFLETGINDMLAELDPHSTYIPARDFNRVNESLEGNFQGIGVEFRMFKDTLLITRVIPGGPSEKAGLRSLDRIVKVEEMDIAGKNISSDSLMKILRGPANSVVNISVYRKSENKVFPVTIRRGVIPIKSINIYEMIDSKTGYIKIDRFSRNTYFEFLDAMSHLEQNGMQRLILDLRDNGGGYLNAATAIANEFLPKGKLIVFTKGKARKRENYFSDKDGKYLKIPITVLINENSASASEIVSGCLQDHDRAIIIGRRSFGKGLVQEQFNLPDGSALRLTVARYFTPSGRFIQKPYSGKIEEYITETYQRYYSGELFHEDSVKTFDTTKYYSDCGRLLVGGGGIYPDIFVPADTSIFPSHLSRFVNFTLMQNFAIEYIESNYIRGVNDPDKIIAKFEEDPLKWKKWIDYNKNNGLEINYQTVLTLKDFYNQRILNFMLRILKNETDVFKYMMNSDNEVKKALEILNKTKSGNPCEFPLLQN